MLLSQLVGLVFCGCVLLRSCTATVEQRQFYSVSSPFAQMQMVANVQVIGGT